MPAKKKAKRGSVEEYVASSSQHLLSIPGGASCNAGLGARGLGGAGGGGSWVGFRAVFVG